MDTLLNYMFSPAFGFAVIRMATPLLFASMAALVSSKSGITNITIDGTMLMSALVGTLVSAFTQNLWIACLAGMMTGMLMGGFLAFFQVKMKTIGTLTGVAINLFTTGASVFICYVVAGDKGSTSKLQSLTFPTIHIPFIQDIPVLGEIVSGHNLLTYGAFLSVFITYILMYKTPLGLKIRAVGEYEKAASSVGENAGNIKVIALVIAGLLSSFGGMFLSMGYVSWFTRQMTGGRGFIGVAANAIGQANPLLTALAAILFAIADALSNVLQVLQIPTEIIYSLPYALTLIVLVVNSGREASGQKRKKAKILAKLQKQEA